LYEVDDLAVKLGSSKVVCLVDHWEDEMVVWSVEYQAVVMVAGLGGGSAASLVGLWGASMVVR
jgi:hypothetical protein